MKPKIKKLWIEALTSGEYKQGRNMLRTPRGSFCCLGVLCDLHDKSKKRKKSNWSNMIYLGNGLVLPQEVREWAGLPSRNPEINGLAVAEINDGTATTKRRTFKTIAKLIDKYL